jgi:hypothetical protein
MEHPRLTVIDPNDGMIVMLAHAKSSLLAIYGTWGPVNADYLTKEPGMAVQDVAAAALLTGRLRFSGRGQRFIGLGLNRR